MHSCHLQEDPSLSQENVSYTGWPISLGVQSLSFCLAPFEIGYDVGGKATVMENFLPPPPKSQTNTIQSTTWPPKHLWFAVLWPGVPPTGRTSCTKGGQSASPSSKDGMLPDREKHLFKHKSDSSTQASQGLGVTAQPPNLPTTSTPCAVCLP